MTTLPRKNTIYCSLPQILVENTRLSEKEMIFNQEKNLNRKTLWKAHGLYSKGIQSEEFFERYLTNRSTLKVYQIGRIGK